MGVKVNAQEDPTNEYVVAVSKMCNIMMLRANSAWKRFDLLFRFTNTFSLQTKILKVIHGFTKSVIEKRHQELLQNNNKSPSSNIKDDIGTKKKCVFLDVLLQSTIDGKPLTDDDIIDEVETFLLGVR